MTDEDEMAYAAVAMVALAEHGIPADMVELLLRGSKRQGIAPGAIYKVVRAVAEQINIHHQRPKQ